MQRKEQRRRARRRGTHPLAAQEDEGEASQQAVQGDRRDMPAERRGVEAAVEDGGAGDEQWPQVVGRRRLAVARIGVEVGGEDLAEPPRRGDDRVVDQQRAVVEQKAETQCRHIERHRNDDRR